jgi:hypothetical protein
MEVLLACEGRRSRLEVLGWAKASDGKSGLAIYVLDDDSLALRVDQILARRDGPEPVHSLASFFDFRYRSDPERFAVSKPFKDIKIVFHVTAPISPARTRE